MKNLFTVMLTIIGINTALFQLAQATPNCPILNEYQETSFEADNVVRRTINLTVDLQNNLDYKTCLPDEIVQAIADRACESIKSYDRPKLEVVIAVDSLGYNPKSGIFIHGTCQTSGEQAFVLGQFIERLKFVRNDPSKREQD